MQKTPKPIVLIILDGWGINENAQYNPILNTPTPTFDKLWKQYPHIVLDAAGESVGLPAGQIGNSEVGHLHIGAGRLIRQDLSRINHSVETGEFNENPVLLEAIEQTKKNKSKLHILGLVSPGGVHSHDRHIMALIELLAKKKLNDCYLHALLDGRDTPPQSALPSLLEIDTLFNKHRCGRIASIIGRYYAMDRDERWDRTERAYNLLTLGTTNYHAASAETALKLAYERGETDEFVQPTAICIGEEKPITVDDNDVIIFMNFRADRARQLTRALIRKSFTEFTRRKRPELADFVTLTEYDSKFKVNVAYPPSIIQNTLGEIAAKEGLKQLRLAETEKYAHVTYFLNGGREKEFKNEKRKLIPSPKVATYDLQPEMSAPKVTDELVKAIKGGRHDLIICNYANPDMIGHTGIKLAANKAVATMDECLRAILAALKSVDGEALITADHGNIEVIYDEKTNQPHTAHTTNLVPLSYIGKRAQFTTTHGHLYDIAPTLLYLLGLEIPVEMTGDCLLSFNDAIEKEAANS